MKNNNLPRIEHIYIHVPFCLQKCGYCSFYSEILSNEKKQKYLKSLLAEIALFQKKYFFKPKTIYFGGGTPSLLTAKEITAILDQFDLSQCEEITLEANPITIREDYADEIWQTPINRISLGVQSFRNDELQLLGRLHDAKQAEEAFQILKQNGVQNISFDLIYGLPNQTKDDLLVSLEKFIELQPDHISTYCLSLEEEVPLYHQKNQIPPDESVVEFYFLIRERLLEVGYRQYEISNFARSGSESKHNLSYWDDKFYLGLGPAASGYICPPECFDEIEMYRRMKGNKRIRYTNPSDVNDYIGQITQGKLCEIFHEIDPETHEKEFIFLALRKTEGLDLNRFKHNFGTDFRKKYKLIIEKYQRQNLLEIEGRFFRLKPEAYFVSNEILAEFV